MAVDRQAEQKIVDVARRLFAEADGDPHQLAKMAAQAQHFAKGADPGEVRVSGGVNRKGEPFVQFQFGGDFQFQLTPDVARGFGRSVYEATEMAVADAALWQFARESLELDESRAAQMLSAVRGFRTDWGGNDAEGEPA